MWMWMWMWGGGGRLRNCTGETSLVWRSLEIVRKRKIAASLQQKQPSRRDGSKCCCKTTIFVLKKKKNILLGNSCVITVLSQLKKKKSPVFLPPNILGSVSYFRVRKGRGRKWKEGEPRINQRTRKNKEAQHLTSQALS